MRGWPGSALQRPGGGTGGPLLWQCAGKEEGESAISSFQRQAVMDYGSSQNSEEVVMGTYQVAVGTSQESREAVGFQLIQP